MSPPLSPSSRSFLLRLVLAVVALGVVAQIVRESFATVQPDEVGVHVRWGKVRGGVCPPGLHFAPFATVHRLSTRTQTFTMAGAGQEAQVNGAVSTLARDQLAVTLDVSVMFHLEGRYAVEVFRAFGSDYDDRVVHPLVRTAVRDAASEFNAMDLVDQRGALQVRMTELVQEKLAATLRGRGVAPGAVTIENLLIRNIDLPNSLDDAIAAVQRQRQATQAAVQANETARQEAARLLTETNGATAAQIARAEANARVVRLAAQAQADANRTLAASITPALLRYQQIEATRAVLASNGTRTVFLPGATAPSLFLSGSP